MKSYILILLSLASLQITLGQNVISIPQGLKENDLIEWRGTISSRRSPALLMIIAPYRDGFYSMMKMQIQGARNRLLFQSGVRGRETGNRFCLIGRDLVAPRKKFKVIVRVQEDVLEVYWDGRLKFTQPRNKFGPTIQEVSQVRLYGSASTQKFRRLTINQIAKDLQSDDCGLVTQGKEVPLFCERGSARNVNCRVVGGKAAPPAQNPWQVAIRRKPQYTNTVAHVTVEHVCGGTLIGNCWVATAAHCFPSTSSTSLRRLVIRVGDYYNRDHTLYSNLGSIESSVDIEIDQVFLHEAYQSYPTARNDVALVRLKKCVSFNDFVRPACLPTSLNQFREGTMCGVTGWGASNLTQHATEYPPCLQVAQIFLKHHTECAKAYTKHFDQMSMMCAGSECVDTCQGDSGGPLVCTEPNSGKFTLWGITSWGMGCANEEKPGVYTRLAQYLAWMYIKIKLSPDHETLVEKIRRRQIPAHYCQKNA